MRYRIRQASETGGEKALVPRPDPALARGTFDRQSRIYNEV
jgi:hypothetical protein